MAKKGKKEETPSLAPADSESENDDEDSVYDSDIPYYEDDDGEDEDGW